MAYTTGIYCHAVKSKVFDTKLFLYKASGDLLPTDSQGHVPAGYYDNLTAAKTAAASFDTKQLPLFVKKAVVQFQYSTGGSTWTDIDVAEGHWAELSNDNKTAVPRLAVQDSTATETINVAKAAKDDVLNLYNISDRVILTKPNEYSDSEFALLMANLNNTFGINLPVVAATYNFNKVTGQWEKTTT